MIKFETIEEFNKVWEEFLITKSRENWRMPKCSYYETIGLKYLKSNRLKWIAETFKLWQLYAEDYLLNKQNIRFSFISLLIKLSKR